MIKQKQIILSILSIFILVLLIGGCLNLNTSNKDYSPGEHTGSITVDGLERSYLIYIPSSYNKTKKIPLVIALHGGGGSGNNMEKLTLGGFNILSDKEDFIVVYPDGIENHWNDGRGVQRYRAQRENIDDVGFISALIDYLVEKYNIDEKRVYVTGMSNGAIMSYRLACELSEKIAAIAPVAGAIPENITLSCSPSRPISVLVINNVEDSMVPWKGGELRFGSLRLGKVLSVSSTVKYWVTHNNCSSSPIITWEPDIDPQDGTRVWKEVYGQGKDGTEVILYGVEGGGHTWPNGYQYMSEQIIGKTSRDIDANEIIWNFFKKH